MNSELDVSVELHCGACGSANLSLPERGADGEIGCNDCGALLGAVAELERSLIEEAYRRSAEALRRNLPQAPNL